MHVTNNKLPLLCLVMNAFGFVTVTSKSTLSPSPPVVIKVDVDPYSANRIGMRYLDGTANDPEKRRKLIVATDGYEYLGSFSAGQWETAVELLQEQHVEHVVMVGTYMGATITRTVEEIGRTLLRKEEDIGVNGEIDVTISKMYEDVVDREDVHNTFRVSCVEGFENCFLYSKGAFVPNNQDLVDNNVDQHQGEERMLQEAEEGEEGTGDSTTTTFPGYYFFDFVNIPCETSDDCANGRVCGCNAKNNCFREVGCYECPDADCFGCTEKFCGKKQRDCGEHCFSPVALASVCIDVDDDDDDDNNEDSVIPTTVPRKMEDLKVGDKVLTDGGSCKEVYTMNHWDTEMQTEYLQIHTKPIDIDDGSIPSTSSNNSGPIELTGNHLIFLHGQSYPIVASKVVIGDILKDVNGNPMIVVDIETIVRDGLYAPFTTDGTIVVNGIVASTYALPIIDDTDDI